VAKVETSKLQAYKSTFLCLEGVAARNVWSKLEVQYVDSTISHKAEVLPETKAEGQ
jgi:hypothetical protein